MKKREKNETKEWMFQGCYKGYSVVRTRRKGAQILTFGSVPSPSVGEMKEPRSEEPSGDKKKKKVACLTIPLWKRDLPLALLSTCHVQVENPVESGSTGN